jgi:hypothetical protein
LPDQAYLVEQLNLLRRYLLRCGQDQFSVPLRVINSIRNSLCNGNPVKYSQNIIEQRRIIRRKLCYRGNFFEQPRAIFRNHRVNQVIDFLMIDRPEHGFYRPIPNFIAAK